MQRSIWKPIAVATLVCGTLDILFAMILTLWRGREIGGHAALRRLGALSRATDMGPPARSSGLWSTSRSWRSWSRCSCSPSAARPALLDKPLLSGFIYGLITYVVMNLIVVPLRFPAAWPPKALSIATQLFAHIVLVGWPTAFIARRYLRG